MSVAVITGSAGLVGSEATMYFAEKGMTVVGIDNGMREQFFGSEASTAWNRDRLSRAYSNYRHHSIDIRNEQAVSDVFRQYASDISLVVHTAAQPSHDWAMREPLTDFTVNANGTSVLLEATRHQAPEAAFIFTSTNKVYGDRPNSLPLVEKETRWEINEAHEYSERGIPETMSIDMTLHSVFGASKVAADVLVQEYGRYFDLKTACFRGGCLTGPNHSGTQLHGFLAYLMRCAATGKPYTIFGYKGKQVRDNIHSADLVRAFDEFYREPRPGAVYNIGGSRFSNCSMLEAIRCSEEITGRQMVTSYVDQNRRGDHTWWISDVSAFQKDYPEWKLTYDVPGILREIYEKNVDRWRAEA